MDTKDKWLADIETLKNGQILGKDRKNYTIYRPNYIVVQTLTTGTENV